MTYRAWSDGSQNRRLMRPRGQQRYCWASSSGLLVAIAALGAIASVLLAPIANAQVPLKAADTDLPSVGARADYALELLRLVNAERRRRGIPPLRLSQPLNQAAQHHADDMAFNDFFSHLGSDGTTLRSRLATVGYEGSEVAENIAAGRASPRETVQQWLDSPGHRANLLNLEFTEVGFGYSNSPLGRFVFYWTQVLGRPAATASQGFSEPEPAAATPEAPEAPAEPAEPAAPAWEDGESLAPEPATEPTPSASATAERPDPDDPAEDEPFADAPASERDPTPSDREPLALLEIAGILEDGDRLLPVDGSLYDLYTFRGTAGQVVRVELESDDFDPYLFLIAPDGQQLAENDDISRDNRNSALRLTLPVDGTYSVLVNSYDPNSRGRYRLVIR